MSATRPQGPDLLLRNARLHGGGPMVDVAITGGTVVLGPGRSHDSAGRPEDVLDLDGRLLLPGLWDAHVHFDQWAATAQRLDLSGAQSAQHVARLVGERLAQGAPAAGTVLLGYGFRDGLWPDAPTFAVLDAVAADVPVVMVSGDLHCAWFNSVALRRFGRASHPTGLLRELEWLPVMKEIAHVPDEVADAWAAAAAEAAAARGVVGVVDFEAPDNAATWTRRIASGTTVLRAVCAVWPERLEAAIARGLPTGAAVPGTDGLATVGPLKVITDGSLNTRTAYCYDPYPGLEGRSDGHGILAVPPAELVPLMRRAHAAGLQTSIHAIGDHANSLVLDAFAQVGSAGTVEHAQLLDLADFSRFAALGIVASIQPEHAMDDRDVADRHWAGRTDRAFAYAGLLAAGARLALGSDAPVAPLDPWIALSAGVFRSRDGRAPWHPEQSLPIEVAFAASTRGRIQVSDGDVADLVVVEADPFTADADGLRNMAVAATVLGGRLTYRGAW